MSVPVWVVSARCPSWCIRVSEARAYRSTWADELFRSASQGWGKRVYDGVNVAASGDCRFGSHRRGTGLGDTRLDLGGHGGVQVLFTLMNVRTTIYLLLCAVAAAEQEAILMENTKVADVGVIGIMNNYSSDEPSSVRLLGQVVNQRSRAYVAPIPSFWHWQNVRELLKCGSKARFCNTNIYGVVGALFKPFGSERLTAWFFVFCSGFKGLPRLITYQTWGPLLSFQCLRFYNGPSVPLGNLRMGEDRTGAEFHSRMARLG